MDHCTSLLFHGRASPWQSILYSTINCILFILLPKLLSLALKALHNLGPFLATFSNLKKKFKGKHVRFSYDQKFQRNQHCVVVARKSDIPKAPLIEV